MEAAIDYYQQALAIYEAIKSPEAERVPGRRNDILFLHERAIDDLTQAMEMYPTALGYYYRGIAHQANGQDQQAMADLELFLAHVSNLYPDAIDDARVRLAQLK